VAIMAGEGIGPMSTKPQDKSKPRSTAGRPNGKAALPVVKVKARPKPALTASVGIPDESSIEQVAAALEPTARDAFRRILAELTEHLGSPEAARLWLVTPAPEFGVSPLTAITQGKAELVLAVLHSRWGPGPAYA
jgi:hypothetical protein